MLCDHRDLVDGCHFAHLAYQVCPLQAPGHSCIIQTCNRYASCFAESMHRNLHQLFKYRIRVNRSDTGSSAIRKVFDPAKNLATYVTSH
jgi:hypothetical protein